MINWQKLFSLLAIFMFTISLSYGQTQVKGKVIDGNGAPVQSATVVIEGTTTGTSTDADGQFSIYARTGQSMIVQFIGYRTETVEITNEDNFFTVTLQS